MSYQLRLFFLILVLIFTFAFSVGNMYSYIVLALLAIVLFKYSTSFFGSSWKPVRHDIARKMVNSVNIKGKRSYDLGSGDGRLVIYAAEKGSAAYGIELEPLKWLYSVMRSKMAGAGAKFILGDFFRRDIRDADVVFIYLPLPTVERLQDKLRKLKKGTLVVSHFNECSKLKAVKKINKDRIYVYRV